MPIKTTLASLDGVDETIAALYVQQGESYILAVEGIDDHPDVANLKNAYERQKADLTTAKQERDAAKRDAAAALKDKPDAEALAAERNRYEARIAELESGLSERDQKLTGLTRDRAFTDALAGAGITDPFYVDLLTAKHAADVKIMDGKAVVETGMGPKDIASWAKDQAAGAWSKAVTPATGGGAKGGDKGGTKPLSEMNGHERMKLAMAGKLTG